MKLVFDCTHSPTQFFCMHEFPVIIANSSFGHQGHEILLLSTNAYIHVHKDLMPKTDHNHFNSSTLQNPFPHTHPKLSHHVQRDWHTSTWSPWTTKLTSGTKKPQTLGKRRLNLIEESREFLECAVKGGQRSLLEGEGEEMA